MSISISSADLFLLIVSSVRYALRRRTYIVGSTIDFVNRYYKYLTKEELSVITRDIDVVLSEHNSGHRLIGDECDYKQWDNLSMKLNLFIKSSKV